MAMNAYKASNYDFHVETLHDIVPEVTNSGTRTVIHNELVILNGFFGEVCDYDDILTTASGNICIDSERTIHTNQVKAGLGADVFVTGAVIYFVPQTSAVVGYLCAVTEDTAVPVGIITGADSASAWVEFRPFVQTMDVSLLRDSQGKFSNTLKVAVVVVETANAGLAIPNSESGLAVGDTIFGITAIASASVVSATVTLAHTGGAGITGAMDIDTIAVPASAALLTDAVITADGLTATTVSATDECVLYIMYVQA